MRRQCQVPTWYCNVSGDRLVGEPDDPAFELCELAGVHGLWLPSTFSACHTGCDYTHVHTSGEPSRIDYFATSEFLPTGQIQTWVDRTIDLLNTQEDHFALLMHMRVTRLGDRTDDFRCQKRKFDLRKLQDPVVRDRICCRLSWLALPEWHVDVNAHALFFKTRFLPYCRKRSLHGLMHLDPGTCLTKRGVFDRRSMDSDSELPTAGATRGASLAALRLIFGARLRTTKLIICASFSERLVSCMTS